VIVIQSLNFGVLNITQHCLNPTPAEAESCFHSIRQTESRVIAATAIGRIVRLQSQKAAMERKQALVEF
jgi:hypothetical protein